MGFEATNSTSLNHTKVGWASEPDARGTWSILVSCISTLFLCSWSAMHLNIPHRSTSVLSNLKSYAYWSLIGIFGPELAIWSAWRQYLSAKALKKEIEVALAETRNSQKSVQYPWTITHGFYAAMGGFVVDLDVDCFLDKPPFIGGITRLTLTPKGISLLAKCGHLPLISKNDILDKSKTDEIAKLLACVQALWMLTQVVGRLILRLPVTLLEVTTIGHGLCAIILYMLWWNKPRFIQEPTRIEGEWMRPICAFMFMASRASSPKSDEDSFRQKFDVNASEITRLAFLPAKVTEVGQRNGTAIAAKSPDKSHGCTWPEDSQSCDGTFQHKPEIMAIADEGKAIDIEHALSHMAETDAVTKNRHRLACEAICKYPAIKQLLKFPRAKEERRHDAALKIYPEMPKRFKRKLSTGNYLSEAWLEGDTENLVCETASNWPTEDLLRTTGGLLMGTVLWLSTIAFSAVHVAAWFNEFPSVLEMWLWRASSTYLGVSGLLWALVHIIAQFSETIWWLWYRLLIGEASTSTKRILTVLCTLGGSMYVFGRIYLIVESFISLRSLPAAVYTTPSWAVSVPHVGT